DEIRKPRHLNLTPLRAGWDQPGAPSTVCRVPCGVVAAGAVAEHEVALGVASALRIARWLDGLARDHFFRVNWLGKVGVPTRRGLILCGSVFGVARRGHGVVAML